MKVRYSIPVVHPGKAPGNIRFSLQNAEYVFRVDGEKFIRIEVEVKEFPRSGLPVIKVNNVSKKLESISVPLDPVWPEIEARLRVVEGVMSLFGLHRIIFEEMETEWIPESEEEKGQVKLLSLKHNYSKKSEEIPVLYDMIIRSIIASDKLSDFEVSMNFNRRGRADVVERRYIDAFYDFYLVIETLFAGGAFRKKEVLDRMMQNSDLVDAVNTTKKDLAVDAYFLSEMRRSTFDYLKANVRELLEHIIDTRGVLHHHSSKKKDSWHPDKQFIYKTDALFLSSLVHQVLSKEAIAAIYSEDVLKVFSDLEIKSSDGNKIKFVDFEPPSK